MSIETEQSVEQIKTARWSNQINLTELAQLASSHLKANGSRQTVSVDYVSKVLAGKIKQPGAKRLEAMRKAVGLC
jgi:hypothetical protein